MRPMRFLGAPVGRRCAVVRSADNRLIIFSPVQSDSESIRQIRALGEVAAFILPSRFHDRFYDGYFQEFPNATFLAAPSVMQDHPKWPLTELDHRNPALSEFDFTELKGMPLVREHVFCHRRTKTLFVADALFNVTPPRGFLDRLLIKFAQVGGRPRVCLLFRTMITNKKAFSTSLLEVLAWDFDRIVPGHGEVIETNGKHVLKSAFHRYLV